ncbi:MAG: hypothetical protein NZ938_02920 [Aigarchaeota archaeon]|nr:hypothetical protein [Candidatus Calditenuaceae archaeon]
MVDRQVLIAAVLVVAAVGVILGLFLWLGLGGASGGNLMAANTFMQTTATPAYGQGAPIVGGCPCQAWMWGSTLRSGASRISIEEAVGLVREYVSSRFGSGFKIHEIMEFQNNFYAAILEEETGTGAFELIIDPYAGVVSPEPGPNMMWNRKYGMHYAMMGLRVEPILEMPIGPEKAVELARRYLAQRFGGVVEVLEPLKFYGYYTMDYKLNGEVHGMLSVNGYTGDIWYHSWHGNFVRELELEGGES